MFPAISSFNPLKLVFRDPYCRDNTLLRKHIIKMVFVDGKSVKKYIDEFIVDPPLLSIITCIAINEHQFTILLEVKWLLDDYPSHLTQPIADFILYRGTYGSPYDPLPYLKFVVMTIVRNIDDVSTIMCPYSTGAYPPPPLNDVFEYQFRNLPANK
jgi:hypothetical protein